MTNLKDKVTAGIETLKDGVSDTASKAGSDAKDVVAIATARVKIATRAAVGNAKHMAFDFRSAAKDAGSDVKSAAKRISANLKGAIKRPSGAKPIASN